MNKKDLKKLNTTKIVDLICAASEELEDRINNNPTKEETRTQRPTQQTPDKEERNPEDLWAGTDGLFDNKGLD